MNNIEEGTTPAALTTFLAHLGWLNKDEVVINSAVPGEGNMNVVLRITTNQRSFILKQSRPYVQKYQMIAAPLTRINTEYLFYQTLSKNAWPAFLPRLLHYQPQDHLIMLEDLGMCQDMTSLYAKKTVTDQELNELILHLRYIHNADIPADYPENMVLRKLNHQHIFVLPFSLENGFNLDDVQPGLTAIAKPYQKDDALKSIVKDLGEIYLTKGDTLVHGDYYPGSWMASSVRIYILDPEFSFIGPASFDLGIMVAHLILCTGQATMLNRVIEYYAQAIDIRLVQQFAGVEIMRRLIGLAQLPLDRSVQQKESLLSLGKSFILAD